VGVLQNPAGLNALTEKIIGGAIAVHRVTGPGLLESVYDGCLIVELRQNGLRVETEKRIPLLYRGFTVGDGFRIDCIVEDKIIVEVKAVDKLAPSAQRSGDHVSQNDWLSSWIADQLQRATFEGRRAPVGAP
jgi:GxxExxY protein